MWSLCVGPRVDDKEEIGVLNSRPDLFVILFADFVAEELEKFLGGLSKPRCFKFL